MQGNNNQNNKYWNDKYNEKEDSGMCDNESKTKYKGNRPLLTPFIFF